MFPRKFVRKVKRLDNWRPDYRGYIVFDIIGHLIVNVYAVYIYSYLHIVLHYKICLKTFPLCSTIYEHFKYYIISAAP